MITGAFSLGYFPLAVGLGCIVIAAAAGGAFYGGPRWALGAAAGAGVVAADFFFLVILAAAWLLGERRGRRFWRRAVTVLGAKALVPPAFLVGIVWAAAAPAVAVAAGALAAATAGPAVIGLYLWQKKTYTLRASELWKS